MTPESLMPESLETSPVRSIDPGARSSPPRGTDAASLRADIIKKLTYAVGKNLVAANERDWFMATALAVRDRILDHWLPQTRESYRQGRKQVYYLSLEFLIGRLLADNVNNLNLTEAVTEALTSLGVEYEAVRNQEPDAALGNGGLGRLAACYMESMATLAIPAFGYGIRYENGLFRQAIVGGVQQEFPEDWLAFGNPWEFARPEIAYTIGFGGTVEAEEDAEDFGPRRWTPAETVDAVAYDTPVVGWRGKQVNTLRLWSARGPEILRLESFNAGDHVGAVADRMRVEAVSKVLYPSDETPSGLELRLRQEFFFASASLQDLVKRHIRVYGSIGSLPDKVAIQLNDTHPAVSIAELMRILVDEHAIAWADAWDITRKTFSYTNHTLLPEALEAWPVPLMERLLPRQMQIIYMINGLYLNEVNAAHPYDGRLLSSVSLIEENQGRRVRMGHLAVVGSHKVNGVSGLHSDLLKKTVFSDFNMLFPGKLVNVTNGITFRRWLHQANPTLTKLLVETVGPEVLDNPHALEKLRPLASDAAFQQRFAAVKRANKVTLAALVQDRLHIRIDPDALFDVQIKRIHEYKRQLLNVLETIALYDAIRAEPTRNWTPRVKIFAGKAAASYHQAKLIIRLANDVARLVNNDPGVRGRLKVVFLPNYNVSLAERIIPAADLSEQISTAGMEASGTGNMKLALNGALTIGTMDGANVEIHERVGADNIFIFGLTTEEVAERRRSGYDSGPVIAHSLKLSQVLDQIEGGVFSPDDRDRYRPLTQAMRHGDYFLVTADFDSYWTAQRQVDERWRHPAAWWRSSILNTANVGWFSSDRSIADYARDIWNIPVEG